MKLVLGYDCKFSVGLTQTGHTYLLTLQVCGRFWWGFQLGIQNFLLHLIALIDIKYPSSCSFKNSFVGFWIVYIIFIISALIDTEHCPRVWLQILSGAYTNRTDIFSIPIGLWKVVAMVPVFYCNYRHQYIYWLQVSSSSYSSFQLCR